MKNKTLASILFVCLFGVIVLSSCSLVKLSGTMTRKTGEAMTGYSKENKGFIGKMAGFGGRINTAVGTTVENVADRDNPDDSKVKRFSDANNSVIDAAAEAATDTDTEKIRVKSKHSFVNVRPAPSTDQPPIGSIKGGTEIIILEDSGDWLKIQLSQGDHKEGWIYKHLVEGYDQSVSAKY